MEIKNTKYIKIITIIIILLLSLFILYKFFEPYIAKWIILFIFSSFNKANLTIIGQNGEELLTYHNNDNLPHPILKINDEINFFKSIYLYGETGLGESYIRGEWNSDNIVYCLNSIFMNKEILYLLTPKMFNSYNKDNKLSDKNDISSHYDNEFNFINDFLYDDLKAYTCGLWFNEKDTLNDAQYNKVNTIIKKLDIKDPNQKILDAGCGWGNIANYVSKITNSHVTGITISDEQVKYAEKNYDNKNLEIINTDYRNVDKQFDYIYCIGMLEHVRYENYDDYFKFIKRCLKPNGRFVLHTIINFYPEKNVSSNIDCFAYKHIFPGSQVPNTDWILDKSHKNGLKTIHFEGFGGQHYSKTLKHWREKIVKDKEELIKKYGIKLFNKYEYYLASTEANFKLGDMGNGHFVMVSDDNVYTTNSFNY